MSSTKERRSPYWEEEMAGAKDEPTMLQCKQENSSEEIESMEVREEKPECGRLDIYSLGNKNHQKRAGGG